MSKTSDVWKSICHEQEQKMLRYREEIETLRSTIEELLKVMEPVAEMSDLLGDAATPMFKRLSDAFRRAKGKT